MAVTGCTQCIKYMLFFFNFVFWLAGGVILGLALWLRHDNKTSNLLLLQFEDNQAPNTFYISVYILIAVGTVMMFVGFLGCYGAIQESQCLLGTFFTCLVILFACEVAAGIWGFMNRETISKELINFYDSAYIKAIETSDSQTKQAAVAVVKVFHDTLDCCGKGSDSPLFNKDTLCKKSTDEQTTNCHVKLKELFTQKQHIIGLAALVIAVIMIFEMIFTMVLCCAIRNTAY
ncbi:CD81 molecule b [Denticeps clupeoides]|uniref:Tetraspanin n=1 Tax=Denticeps clupeoides TaxID=299321 RepID=A0AAY4EAA8_9TELE|nr:CD81 antigen-like [Denticeps clupeoides]